VIDWRMPPQSGQVVTGRARRVMIVLLGAAKTAHRSTRSLP
jgi:hypothetical protein